MVVVGIMIYLAFRFEWKFAVAAIIANLHDVIIILGFFAFFQWEFSLAVLAAVLAVLGYSVNESVVIFDRIRENFRRYRKMNTVQIIDNAITSTISRTIITHGSTQIMVLSMLLFGGPTLLLLRAGADHRHPVRHLFLRLRRRRHRHVAGHQARGPGQVHGQEGRGSQRSQRRRYGLRQAGERTPTVTRGQSANRAPGA